jgi:hypothetical protein
MKGSSYMGSVGGMTLENGAPKAPNAKASPKLSLVGRLRKKLRSMFKRKPKDLEIYPLF